MVRVVAAIPAAGLIAGSAAGLVWLDSSTLTERSAWILWPTLTALTFLAAAAVRRPLLLSFVVVCGFAEGGAVLAADSWRLAWRSTLRVAFDEIALNQRSIARRAGLPLPEDDSAAVVLVGTVNADAAMVAGGVSLNVQVSWIGDGRLDGADNANTPVDGGALLTVAGSLAAERVDAWRAGRTIRAPAILRRPARYLDPGVPDQERVLARRGTALVGTVKSAALVDVLAPGSAAAERAAHVRHFVRHAIRSGVGRWSQRSAGIVTAIVIGDRTGLDEEVERRLQEAGTYHVIAISGGNIAILVGLALAGFRVAGVLGRSAMSCALAGLLGYAYLVGRGASVERATLMAVVFIAGRILDFRGSPLNALAVAASILVLENPLVICEPAFLLTFGATLAILAASPVIRAVGVPRILVGGTSIVIASAATEAMLIPVAATVFSRITFAGLVLNLAAIPLMALAQIAGMIVVPLFAVSERLAAVAGSLAHVGAEGLVRSAGILDLAPALTWRVAPPSGVATTLYYIALAGAWTMWQLRPRSPSRGRSSLRYVRALSATAFCTAAIWILLEPAALLRARGDGRLHVTFLDVGQGDAALVRFPHGGTLLVDAGGLGGSGAFDIGDRVVAPLLRTSGVRRLGTIALSHGDADHIGGARSVIREFRPWELWEGIPVARSQPLRDLQTSAGAVGTRWANVQAADRVRIDEVDVFVRHPGVPDWERQRTRNNDSIVLELVWHDVSIVLTGDIGREAELAISSRFAASPLRVIKVPHHGSQTSSSPEFLRALAPRLAVVSVGRSNHFGHPAPAVLDRYALVGAEIFRTDRDGAVEVESDGRSLDVRGFTGRHLHLVPR